MRKVKGKEKDFISLCLSLLFPPGKLFRLVQGRTNTGNQHFYFQFMPFNSALPSPARRCKFRVKTDFDFYN